MEGYRRSGGGDQRAKGENDLPRSEKTSVQEIPAAAAAQRSAIIHFFVVVQDPHQHQPLP